jgi:uncharacterized RDD family membrane protein YckC
MGDTWYYSRAGAQLGPVDVNALRQLIAQGEVTEHDLVWSDGMPNWRRAGEVSTFFAPAPESAAPSPYGVQPHAQQPYAQQPYGQQPYGQPQYGQPQYGQPAYGANPAMLPYRGAPTEVQTSAGYAGFWLRFCAVLIDTLILFVVNFVIGFVIGLTLALAAGGIGPGERVLMNILSIVIGWLYSALQESSAAQATIGKRAVGIFVTDTQGQRISFARATGRHFAKILSALILLIGYIMAAFTERKQALHDQMADTLVLRR